MTDPRQSAVAGGQVPLAVTVVRRLHTQCARHTAGHGLQVAACGAALFAVLVLAAPQAGAWDSNPGIAPPESRPFTLSYAQWSARWWQWFISIPVSVHPGLDTTGANCEVGQSGPLWFLAGSAGGNVQRTCTIPAGRAVMLPVINADCSTIEGNGSTFAVLRTCAAGLINAVTLVSATLDGVRLTELADYRFASPPFDIVAPPDPTQNILSVLDGKPIGPGPSKCASDGYWIIVNPLPPGTHTLSWHGIAVFPTFKFDESGTVTIVSVAP